ncbi:hypothetical protein COO60DRAFT_662059 [Scenedesmus sp. NREL 46B-D3]|nr:hypothetical protein COO60DRAFT_662059 [Scenedesmus sp. NREL 46B-D3]
MSAKRSPSELVRIRVHANIAAALKKRLPAAAAAAAAAAATGSGSLRERVGWHVDEFVAHIELPLHALRKSDKTQMTMDDWRRTDGTRDYWTLGHIQPVVGFDLTDAQRLKECFALSNLHPELAADNYAAGAALRRLGGEAATAAAVACSRSTAASEKNSSHSGGAGSCADRGINGGSAGEWDGAATGRCHGSASCSSGSAERDDGGGSSSVGGSSTAGAGVLRGVPPSPVHCKRKRWWTDEEVRLLRKRHSMFEAGQLGRTKNGGPALDQI